MNNKNVVAIIGGGVAGLSAGGFLARQGYHVKLYEANDKLGGSCATTHLNGYTFNDGALYLALPEVLDHVFTRLGLDRPSLLPLRRITAGHTTLLPDGSVVTIGDRLELTLQRASDAPDGARLQEELRRMMEKWKPVLRLFEEDILLHPFSFGRMLRKGWRHLPKLRGDLASELRALFSDEAVRAALSGALLFSGLPPDRTPVMSLLGVVSLLSEGFYLPEGGMGQIPEALSVGLKENGGEIHLNAHVKRVHLKNGRVSALEVEGHGLAEVGAAISTVSGILTAERLLAPEDVPTVMRRRAESAPLSHKVLCLQLGLANKVEESSHSVSILPLMGDQAQVFTPYEGELRWPVFFVPTVTLPKLAPPGGSIIEIYPPIRQELAPEAWDEELSSRTVETAIKALESRYRLDIAVKRALTPNVYQNRMRLYKGAVYGLSPTADPRAMFSHKTAIPGLFQAGQTTYPGYGVGASAMSGIFAAEALFLDTD